VQDQGHYTQEDRRRLAPGRVALATLMLDDAWHTPYELAQKLGLQNAGTVTSHLRDLKASGLYTYERRRTANLHEYKLKVVHPEQLPLLRGNNMVTPDPLPIPEGFTEVDSTNVRAVRFMDVDLYAGELQVIFRNGGRYHYQEVPKEGYQNLLKAESKGAFLGRNIKPHFQCYQADFTTGRPLAKQETH
jgi:hypothetical protein